MKRPTSRQVINFGARFFLALVFVIAALAKLVDPNQFAQRVGDFGLVYDALVTPAAWAIVAAELGIGIALVFRVSGSLTAAIVLLLVFMGVLSYGIALGLDIECGCFGPVVHVSLSKQLLADFGLLLVCAIIYFSDRPIALHGSQNTSTDESL